MRANPDSIPIKMVIGFVGAAMIISLLTSAYLIFIGRPAGEMQAVTLACVAGLLGLLGNAPQRTRHSDEGPTEVTGPKGKPVEVEEVTEESKDAQ